MGHLCRSQWGPCVRPRFIFLPCCLVHFITSLHLFQQAKLCAGTKTKSELAYSMVKEKRPRRYVFLCISSGIDWGNMYLRKFSLYWRPPRGLALITKAWNRLDRGNGTFFCKSYCAVLKYNSLINSLSLSRIESHSKGPVIVLNNKSVNYLLCTSGSYSVLAYWAVLPGSAVVAIIGIKTDSDESV